MAADDLVQTKDTILEIALRYGYDSHEGFTRCFKAYIGITPMEYRKYHHSINFQATRKGKCIMIYTKTIDKITKEINGLIVLAKETAKDTRKQGKIVKNYSPFWELIADKTDSIADAMTDDIKRISAITQFPDEISARFLILKTIENAAFQCDMLAFQTGLTMARAKPEHQEIFQSICDRYTKLSNHMEIKIEQVAIFFQELLALIFQDIRTSIEKKLQKTAEIGMAAAKCLQDTSLPYKYLADELTEITNQISSTPSEQITLYYLENLVSRLDLVLFTANVDAFRTPSHKPLFDKMEEFKKELNETVTYIQYLSENIAWTSTEQKKENISKHRKCQDIAFQGNMLLFYLKGEIRKLETSYLNDEQRNKLYDICDNMKTAISLIEKEEHFSAGKEIFKNVHQDIYRESETLGIYNKPLRFIADKINKLS